MNFMLLTLGCETHDLIGVAEIFLQLYLNEIFTSKCKVRRLGVSGRMKKFHARTGFDPVCQRLHSKGGRSLSGRKNGKRKENDERIGKGSGLVVCLFACVLDEWNSSGDSKGKLCLHVLPGFREAFLVVRCTLCSAAIMQDRQRRLSSLRRLSRR